VSGDPSLVRAAGGVVWRARDGVVEVLLVHRPRYDDWSFPKGKCDPGEGDEACAIREVDEETGMRCVLGAELPTASYVDHRNRPKVVRYWAMEAEAAGGRSHPFVPNDEVDDLAWVTLDEAGHRLTYGRDLEVLAAFAATTRA
jgi:8-oxo-dGTP diphosphatase